LVSASLRAACRSALGRVMEKSELARCPRLETGIAEVVEEVVELDVVEVVDVEDELEELEVETEMLERGEKFTGTLRPVEAMAAVT
jgi:hypothetical protein